MLLLLLFSTLVLSVLANVEKTIFVAPPPNVSHPSHSFEFLDTLSPSTPSVSKSLNASFPSEEAPQGVSSWFRLVNLSPGQRYEVRICWLATVSDSSPFKRPWNSSCGAHLKAVTATYILSSQDIHALRDPQLCISVDLFGYFLRSILR